MSRLAKFGMLAIFAIAVIPFLHTTELLIDLPLYHANVSQFDNGTHFAIRKPYSLTLFFP